MSPATLTTTDPTDAAAFSAAAQASRRQAPSVYWASFFLPRAKRRGVLAVAAFCGLIADALAPVDLPGDSGGACGCGPSDQLVESLRQRLDEIYAGRLELPLPQFRSVEQRILHAAARTIATYALPRRSFDLFVDGCLAEGATLRYATWRSLHRQLSHSGGAVAELMAAVLGAMHSDAPAGLRQLGAGLRLTMILRDLPAALAAGRVPLPLEDLARCGCPERELLQRRPTAAARRVMRLAAQRARQSIWQGAEQICWLGGDGARLFASALAMQALAILEEIDRRNGDLFTRPLRLTAGQKLRRLVVVMQLAQRQSGEPMPRGLR